MERESHEVGCRRRLRVTFTKKMEERKLFMKELKSIRQVRSRNLFKAVKKLVGPPWYQFLTTTQRKALDTLKDCIYQDLLEARPLRSTRIMKTLGIQPLPNRMDLLCAMFYGQNDPKEMLAQLYLTIFGHPFSAKRVSYTFNQRMILSSIFYLGQDNLIKLLRERFKPDPVPPPPPPPKKKRILSELKSPYLQPMRAVERYGPKPPKQKGPLPLPKNLDDLQEPWDEVEEVFEKPPPPPPPPPPPKKRTPRELCDKYAGLATRLTKKRSEMALKPVEYRKPKKASRRINTSKLLLNEGKKTYGLGLSGRKKNKKNKPKVRHTAMNNTEYAIKGVYTLNGRSCYIIDGTVAIPPTCHLIHGGHVMINGEYLTQVNGYAGIPVQLTISTCDCYEKYNESVFEYVKNTKCRCNHFYDYHNEGEFDLTGPKYFTKPTMNGGPFQFDQALIFQTDSRLLHLNRAAKKAFDTDSLLWEDDGYTINPRENRKKRVRKSSKTCLGEKPKISDYLRCALRFFRHVNIAAKLPDVHMTPELQEWMRYRIYGPFTPEQKKKMYVHNTYFWSFLKNLGSHVTPKPDQMFMGKTTWKFKQHLNNWYEKYVTQYKLSMFRAQAYLNNLLWATMCQAQFPDKQFREVFNAYLVTRIGELQIMNPYDAMEAAERRRILQDKRYMCLPEGWEPDSL